MRKENKIASIIAHYETCLEKHGDSHLGVDWPNKNDAEKRYQVMLEIIKDLDATGASLLDFGCGAGHLLTYLEGHPIPNIRYTGLDISKKFISLCHSKFPDAQFLCADVLAEMTIMEDYDYVVMNGVFTEKRNLTFDEMFNYFQKLIVATFANTKKGLAFNVMSKQVDWERADLFHLPLDVLASFLVQKISRNFVIRNDYGLYEYTTYIYR